MVSQGQGIPFLHRHRLGQIQLEVLGQHLEGFCVAHQANLGIAVHKGADAGSMIRLQMVHHQVIHAAALQFPLQVGQEPLRLAFVHGIQHRHLVIQNHIGIVAHAVGNGVLPFKKIQVFIIHADITNVLGNHLHVAPRFQFGP